MRQSLTALAFATVLVLASGPYGAFAQGTTSAPDPAAAPAGTAAPAAASEGAAKPRKSRKTATAATAGTDAPGAAAASATTTTEAPAKRQPSAAQKAHQDRIRSCSAEWKASGQTGQAAHRAFMSECLKKKT